MFGGVQIAELWRYPVKSLQGERLDAVAVTADGLEGDRQFAIYDVESGLGLTGRRVPELLFASARMRADGTAEITLPDGSLAGDDNTLSNWLGRSVALRSAATEAARRYENVIDFEHESTSDWEPFDGAARAFHDNPGARVSLCRPRRWDRGIRVVSERTYCSTAKARTPLSDRESPSARRRSTSTCGSNGA